MAPTSFRRLSERLAAQAEAVCRCYLSNGKKNGHYWLVGDVLNTPGRSLYVRLTGPVSGPGAAGKWTDAATGEHGDLVDLIRQNRSLTTPAAVREEILQFLAEPRVSTPPPITVAPGTSATAAARLFAAGQPVPGTLADVYLRARGITCALDLAALRFHPRCFYRDSGARYELPALLGAVTNAGGGLTAVQRTYLAPDGSGKAALTEPRRALGDILGHAVRFGEPDTVLAVGEGIETMLALRSLLPQLPMAAALSANHLAVFQLPKRLTQLYIAQDNDEAGRGAAAHLTVQAQAMGCEVRLLRPRRKDWNDDLCLDGVAACGAQLRPQLAAAEQEMVAGAAVAVG